VKERLERGAVRIGGRLPRKGDRTVAGARVEVTLPTEDPRPVAQPELPLRVLHIDEQLVALDKPAGMPSHPLEPGERGTVVNALVARHPECADASDHPREGGLVHRLDTLTSGVLLAARTRDAWRAVREAFSGRQVDKRYLVLVRGRWRDAKRTVDVPLHKFSTREGERRVRVEERGRNAITIFRLERKWPNHDPPLALLEAELKTGRTHQIRVHLAHLGHVLAGDDKYGDFAWNRRLASEGLKRMFLHARMVAFMHPASGESVRIESPLPEDLAKYLAKLTSNR
jgi:23S rRNA pseudouridine1911/1915/1917 synthase